MPAVNHLHTYERLRKPKEEYYRCLHPDCSHYIHRDLLPGKRAACSCGEEFILSFEDLQLKLPHCVYCGKNARPRTELPSEEEEIEQIEERWTGEL